MNKSRGFTLIEVLVALVILSLMALLAWRGIDALLKSREIAQSSIERSSRLQTVMQQWEQDLANVQDSQVVPALVFDGASLRLTRRQPQGLQVVAWTLRDGTLYRWAGPLVQNVTALQDSVERSQQFVADDSQRVTALQGVNNWLMYFYRDNAWSNAQSSAGTVASPAPTASAPQVVNQNQLPTGVRVVIEFGPGSGLQGTLTKTTLLGAQS